MPEQNDGRVRAPAELIPDDTSIESLTVAPGDLVPADPIVVSPVSVVSSISPPEWFLVLLDTGELTIAALDPQTKVWTRVDEDFWPEIKLVDGLPQQFEIARCPICASQIDVTFSCAQRLDSIYSICPKCGYQFDVIDNLDDDGIGGS